MDSRKRVEAEAALNANSDVKKLKQEMESSSTAMGSKSKPFTNFFRTAVPQMINLGPNQASIYVASPPLIPDGPSRLALKTRLCNKFNTAEGCQFGDKCRFAHGECELGTPISLDDPFFGQMTHSSPPLTFGGPLTAKISVDASLARAVIFAKNKICRETDVALFIPEHMSDPNLTNIELKGDNFDLVKIAIDMVIKLIGKNPGAPASQMVGPNKASIYVASPPPIPDGPSRPPFKTRLCYEYDTTEGCQSGVKCRFAHGKGEVGKPISLEDHKGEVGKPISLDDHYAMASSLSAGQIMHSSSPSSDGDRFTAKISVNASLVRAVIWAKNEICLEGVALFIQDHVSDPNLRNIELEGKFGEVKRAMNMVIELIGKIP